MDWLSPYDAQEHDDSGQPRCPLMPRSARPSELRHSFVSLLSSSGVPIEDISRLVGHVSTNVTEKVYRHQLRPVMTRGAATMDQIFKQMGDHRRGLES